MLQTTAKRSMRPTGFTHRMALAFGLKALFMLIIIPGCLGIKRKPKQLFPPVTEGSTPIQADPIPLEEDIKHDDECDALKRAYIMRGFLTGPERNFYCAQGCGFLKFECMKEYVAPPDSYAKVVFDNLSESLSDVLGNYSLSDFDADLVEEVDFLDPAVRDVWETLFYQFWTAPLGLIPVVLNHRKQSSAITSSLCIIAFIGICMGGFMGPATTMHHVVVAFLCLVSPANSQALGESVFAMIFSHAPLFFLFIADVRMQLGIVVMVILGFFSYVWWIFFHKKASSGAVAFMLVMQVFVLNEQLWFVRDAFAERSIGGATIEMALNCVMPRGKSVYFGRNVLRLSLFIATKGITAIRGRSALFLIVSLSQVLMFCFFRMALGAYYLFVLRHRMDVNSLANGGLVYLSDLWGPVTAGFRIMLGYERLDHRRVLYASSGLLLSLFEYLHAREFFILKAVVSTMDVIFVRSSYGRATRYLASVDFMLAAFPQDNAPSWMELNLLAEIGKYVMPLTVMRNDVTVKGICCVLNTGGRAMLYTVKHVIAGGHTLVFPNGDAISTPNFTKINGSNDPMVACKVEGFEGAPQVDMLLLDEIRFVESLSFINVDEDGLARICWVPHFTIDKEVIRASVNLKNGDSGGPCFATMHDGSIKMCGVVSSGTPRGGGGNIISFCFANPRLELDSSDEETDLTKLASIKSFNAARRSNVPSRSSMTSRGHIDTWKLRRGIWERAKASADDLILISKCAYRITYDDFIEHATDDDAIVSKMMDADGRASPVASPKTVRFRFKNLEGRRPPDVDEDTWNEYKRDRDEGQSYDDWNKHRKKGYSRSRNRKDRAARKRQVMQARVLHVWLGGCYVDGDARSIFAALMQGSVPEFSEISGLETLVGPMEGDPRGWIIDDDMF